MDWLRTVIELADPMIARQAIEDAETIDALDFEMKCESWHSFDGECSLKVAAIQKCCNAVLNVCAAHVHWINGLPDYTRCVNCSELITECVTFLAVSAST